MIDLTAKVALITGSSRGIGRACAVEMARAGADICVNYRSHPAEAEEGAAESRDRGRRAIIVGGNLSDRAAGDAAPWSTPGTKLPVHRAMPLEMRNSSMYPLKHWSPLGRAPIDSMSP